jgi:hypothetical protein
MIDTKIDKSMKKRAFGIVLSIIFAGIFCYVLYSYLYVDSECKWMESYTFRSSDGNLLSFRNGNYYWMYSGTDVAMSGPFMCKSGKITISSPFVNNSTLTGQYDPVTNILVWEGMYEEGKYYYPYHGDKGVFP